MIWIDKARIFAVFAVIVLRVSAIVVVGIKDFYDHGVLFIVLP
jgi:hypothetical protein